MTAYTSGGSSMQTRIIAKTLVFDDRSRVLLLVRSADDPQRPSGYDLPGGNVDEGEEVVAGAAREADEEAGLTLAPSDLELVYAVSKRGYRKELRASVNIVWLGFIAKLPAGATIRLSHEHQAFEWVTMDKAISKSKGATQRFFMQHVKDNGIKSELWSR